MRFRPAPEFSEFAPKVLFVPALCIGNAGQLALDVVINTASLAAEAKGSRGGVVILGHAMSHNVLPMAATNDALLSSRLREGGCLTAVTVYGLPGGVAILQVRSAVASGKERAFAEEVATFARQSGFAECACLAAADPIFLSAAERQSVRTFHMSTRAGAVLAERAAAAAASQALSAPGEGNPVSLAVARASGLGSSGIGAGPGIAEQLLTAFEESSSGSGAEDGGEVSQVPMVVLYVLRTDEGSGGRVDDALALAEAAAAVFPSIVDRDGEGVAATLGEEARAGVAAVAAGRAAGAEAGAGAGASTAPAVEGTRAGRWVLPPSFEALFGISSTAPLQEDQGMLFA